MSCTHPYHYQKSDFTPEEIARGNALAIAVLIKKMKVCRTCGKTSKPGATRYNKKMSEREKGSNLIKFKAFKRQIERRWRKGFYTTYKEAEKALLQLNRRYKSYL